MEKKKSKFTKGDTDEEKLERFAAGGVISIISLVVGGLCGGLFWVMAMTRFLGPRDFGILGPVFNGYWMICTLASLGVNSTITTYVSHHYEKEKQEAENFMLEGNKLLFVLAIIFFIIFELVAYILKLNHKIDPTSYGIFAVITVGVSFTLLFWSNSAILTGIQRLDLVAICNLVLPVTMFLVSLIAVLVIQHIFGKKSTLDIIGAISGVAAGNVVAYFVSFYILQKLHSFPLKKFYSFSLDFHYVKKILKFGGWSAVCLVGHNVFMQLSPTLVGLLANKYQMLGSTPDANKLASSYYNTSFIFGQAPMLLLGITLALIPAISEAQSQGKKLLMQQYYTMALKISFGIIFLLVAVYLNCGGLLVQTLSGKGYPVTSIYPIISVLSVSLAFIAIMFLYLNLFIALKQPNLGAIIILVAIFIETFLVYIISLTFHSPFAVTFSVFTCAFIVSIILISLTKKNFSLDFPFYTFIISLGAAVIAVILSKFIFSPALVGLGLSIVLTFISYLFCYTFFGGYNTEDIKSLNNFTSKNKFLRQIGFKLGLFITKSPFFEWYNK